MKLKYHKIRNVPLDVCTAEQKLAYNVAFSYSDILKGNYRADAPSFVKAKYFSECVHWLMKMLPHIAREKYNIDAIFSALNAGIENYINSKHTILSSYEEIGEIFPAIYL